MVHDQNQLIIEFYVLTSYVFSLFFSHQDAKNNNGDTFETLLQDQHLHELVNPVKYTRLTCLAARTIRKHGIKYQHEVPKALHEFIESH